MAEVHVKWSVILMDLLGPDIFSTLWMKEQVLHCERAHLKVPDWSLVWNELLTKKLPMFLSRLNEISGGCEKIVPVSESFWSNLKFLRMIDLTAWLWGWNVRVNGMRSVFPFSAVCSDDCRSICWARLWPAWTTETGQPRLSKNWHIVVTTLIFPKNQRQCASFSINVAILFLDKSRTSNVNLGFT